MIVTRRCDAAGLNASEWAKFAASWVAWAGWPVCVTCDRGVRNRGMFAQVLSAHGVAEEMEQEELNQFVLPGMTDAEQLRKKEWLQIHAKRGRLCGGCTTCSATSRKQLCDRYSRQVVHHQNESTSKVHVYS